MAGGKAANFQTTILNAILRNTAYTSVATVYVGLFTVAPTGIGAGGGTEVTGNAYARQSVTFGAPVQTNATSSTNNSAQITFPAATGTGWGTIVGAAIFDAVSAGNMLYYIPVLTGVNDVQTITVTGTPTGGTFTLNTVSAGVTLAIPYNATAAQTQEAIEGSAGVGASNVVCTGGPFPGSNVVATFQGALANQSVTLMTLANNSLTGGTSPSASVAHTTTGATGNKTINVNDQFIFNSNQLVITEG